MGRISESEFRCFISKWEQVCATVKGGGAAPANGVKQLFEPSNVEAMEWTVADIYRFCFLPVITEEDVQRGIADIDTVCRRLQEDSR